VAALEPALLTQPLETTAFGIQFSFAVGHPEWVEAPALEGRRRSRVSALLTLRPGSYHTFTLLGKLLGGKPLYRYRERVLGFDRFAIDRAARHTDFFQLGAEI